jgi:hypothetical protein
VIARHPMSVVASHVDQPWAPSTVAEVLDWLAPLYERWFAARPRLLRDQRYVEVRIEDLADRWPTSRAELFDRLGLSDADTTATFSRDRVHHRDHQLTPVQRGEVIDRLGWAIEHLGYATPDPESAPHPALVDADSRPRALGPGGHEP